MAYMPSPSELREWIKQDAVMPQTTYITDSDAQQTIDIFVNDVNKGVIATYGTQAKWGRTAKDFALAHQSMEGVKRETRKAFFREEEGWLQQMEAQKSQREEAERNETMAEVDRLSEHASESNPEMWCGTYGRCVYKVN